MRSVEVLTNTARQLNRQARAGALPALYFVIDPVRTPDPAAVMARLPRGAAVIYRHFGAAKRFETAARLMKIARKRRLY
ncbi:MAG: thiamine monophosphate synthase, partial [Caulobacterales bacterium]